ncbi:MAG: MFS transporter, partial [Alistipes sp.]
MTTEQASKFKYWQWRTIITTMIGYALFYFVRKNFSFAMPGLAAEYGISNTSFGLILAIVGLVYGFSRFGNGLIADRMNARFHMSFGLLLCALASFAFGFAPRILGIEIGVAPHILVVAFAVLLVLNNIFQGSGFPPCARLLSHWVPPHELATKMSIWNTSHSIGAGLLAILCGFIMGNMGADLSSNSESVEKMTHNYLSANFKDDVKKSDIRISKVTGITLAEEDWVKYAVNAPAQGTYALNLTLGKESEGCVFEAIIDETHIYKMEVADCSFGDAAYINYNAGVFNVPSAGVHSMKIRVFEGKLN